MFRHKYVMSLLPPRRLQSLIVANMKMVHGQTQLMVNYVLSWSAKVCWVFFPTIYQIMIILLNLVFSILSSFLLIPSKTYTPITFPQVYRPHKITDRCAIS